MNQYAIGDIQGCFNSFLALLKEIEFDATTDQLWFVGDLVNRGPDSLSMLRWCQEHSENIRCVLGNHDLHLLALAYNIKPLKKKESDLKRVLDASDAADLLAWLSQQPLIYQDARAGYCMVHAGLPAEWPLQQCLHWGKKTHEAMLMNLPEFLGKMYGNQPASWSTNLSDEETHRFVINSFTRMRMCHPDGSMDFEWKGPPEQSPSELSPWFAQPHRNNHDTPIVFGHWSALGQIHWPEHNVWGIDTGCVWGRQLTAIRLQDQKLFQVDSLDTADKK